jgi:hypothetical protein
MLVDRFVGKEGDSSSRRAFMRGAVGVLGVGVIAAAELGGAPAALADPAHQHCVSTSNKFVRMACIGGQWIEYYDVRCTVCLDRCSTFTQMTCIACTP